MKGIITYSLIITLSLIITVVVFVNLQGNCLFIKLRLWRDKNNSGECSCCSFDQKWKTISMIFFLFHFKCKLCCDVFSSLNSKTIKFRVWVEKVLPSVCLHWFISSCFPWQLIFVDPNPFMLLFFAPQVKYTLVNEVNETYKMKFASSWTVNLVHPAVFSPPPSQCEGEIMTVFLALFDHP